MNRRDGPSRASYDDLETATLQIAPITRQTVVKTITTTTIQYPPIRLPRPRSPNLSGDYTLDKARYPLELSSHASGVRKAQSSVGIRLGHNEGIKATYYAHDAQGRASGRDASGQRENRKGKRRMQEEEEDAQQTSEDEREELRDIANEQTFLRKHQNHQSGSRSKASTSQLPSWQAQDVRSREPPRKKSRVLSSLSTDLAQNHQLSLHQSFPNSNASGSFSKNMPLSRNRHTSETVLPSPQMSPDPVDSPESGQEERLEQDAAPGPKVKEESPHPTDELEGYSHGQVVLSHTVEEVHPNNAPNPQEDLSALLSNGSRELSSLYNLPSLAAQFSYLSPSVQTSVLYQLLRQSSVQVLQNINAIIQPALKRDFISDLPSEISSYILLYLDTSSLLRCIGVSRNWQRFIDNNGRIWVHLLQAEDLWIGDTIRSDEAEADLFRNLGTTRYNRKRKERAELGVHDLMQHPKCQRDYPFLRDWGKHAWDMWFDEDHAALSTEAKMAEIAHAGTRHPASPSSSKQPRRHVSTKLRHSKTRPLINASVDSVLARSSRRQHSDPHARTVHPMKLLFKKRWNVRDHWNSPKRQPSRVTFQGEHTSVVTCIQFDNDKLITASDDPSIEVYDTQSGKLRMKLRGHDGGVWALQYVGNVLVSGSTDRTVRIWNTDTGECLHAFVGHTSTVRCLQIIEPVNVNPDKTGTPVWEPPYPLIATGSRDHTLRIWRLPHPSASSSTYPSMPYAPPSPSDGDPALGQTPEDNPYHLRVLQGHDLAVRALAAHGRTLVSGSYDTTLRVWDVLSGQCEHVLVGHTQKVYSVILDHERKRCASGSMDGTVRVWSIESGTQLFRLDGHSSLVGLLGLSYHYLVSAGADSTLKVWDPFNGECIDTLSGNGGAITCFKHDDFKVVSGSEGQLRIWDIRKGRVVKDLLEDMSGVWQVQFSDRFCIAAVQRGGVTDFEVLDFFPELREDYRKEYGSESESINDEDMEVDVDDFGVPPAQPDIPTTPPTRPARSTTRPHRLTSLPPYVYPDGNGSHLLEGDMQSDEVASRSGLPDQPKARIRLPSLLAALAETGNDDTQDEDDERRVRLQSYKEMKAVEHAQAGPSRSPSRRYEAISHPDLQAANTAAITEERRLEEHVEILEDALPLPSGRMSQEVGTSSDEPGSDVHSTALDLSHSECYNGPPHWRYGEGVEKEDTGLIHVSQALERDGNEDNEHCRDDDNDNDDSFDASDEALVDAERIEQDLIARQPEDEHR